VRSLWDLRKFFDSIDPVRLAEDVGELPIVPTCLAMGLHEADRYIGIGGAFVGPISGFERSIVAGCRSSTSLCRRYLKGPLAAAREAEPTVSDWQHVDDICQLTEGENECDVALRSFRAGLAFAEAAVRKGLTIASKTVVVSNRPYLADFLAAEYREAVFDVQSAGSTEMLGVRSQLEGARNLGTFRARWSAFKERVARISMLSQVNKKASKLLSAHSTVGTYGDATIGSSPAQQRLFAQAGSKAAGKFGLQACPISVCGLTYKAMPAVSPVARLFSWWLRWFADISVNPELNTRLSSAWSEWRDAARHLNPTMRWKQVTGPSQAVIAHLWDWGWVPAFPGWWAQPPLHSATIGLSAASDALLIQQVSAEAERQEWLKAAQHYGSGELE
jgi:hypothetical protein